MDGNRKVEQYSAEAESAIERYRDDYLKDISGIRMKSSIRRPLLHELKINKDINI